MAREEEPRIGDTLFLVRVRGRLDRLTLKRRDLFLQHLGTAVAEFCKQIGAAGLEWPAVKIRLGDDGWQTAVVFTKHMYETREADGDEFSAIPWRLITISMCPVRRATDASADQLAWLDQLIEEAQRHCVLLKEMKKTASA
jgi:hypothetical protein